MIRRRTAYGVWLVGPSLVLAGLAALPSEVRSDAAPQTPRTAGATGVLVIAHGGSARWNGLVRDTVKQADLHAPVEVAFGMGMHPQEVHAFQEGVEQLEQQGVSRVVVIPLLVSSFSEVFRQYEYLFGIQPQSQWPEAGAPVTLKIPVVMGRALDDHPAVAEILLERARELSRDPANETVIVVAHGPNEDADNQRWLQRIQRLAQQVQHTGGFRDVQGFTIRDDAPDSVRADAEAALRKAVETASGQGRVLVVPLLIAQGGIEQKIPTILKGLSYAYNGHTLLPHDKVAQWIAQQAAQAGSTAPSSRCVPCGQ